MEYGMKVTEQTGKKLSTNCFGYKCHKCTGVCERDSKIVPCEHGCHPRKERSDKGKPHNGGGCLEPVQNDVARAFARGEGKSEAIPGPWGGAI